MEDKALVFKYQYLQCLKYHNLYDIPSQVPVETLLNFCQQRAVLIRLCNILGCIKLR